jgi:hypothetical protein
MSLDDSGIMNMMANHRNSMEPTCHAFPRLFAPKIGSPFASMKRALWREFRGKPVVELTNQTTLLHGPHRANSQKPVEFYDFVERLCPAPRYAYLFSRYRYNEKWDCHCNEAPPAQADPAE